MKPPHPRPGWTTAVALTVCCATFAFAQSQVIRNPQSAAVPSAPEHPPVPPRAPDVVFVPTPSEVVDKMLELAQIKPGDVLYDLGCGDGRIVVAAAQRYGIRAVGVDIDPERVQESRENVKAGKVEHLVTIRQADIFQLDFSEASVVTLYLLPSLNVRLMPQLAALKPGTRIVSHDFDMAGAKPKRIVGVDTDEREVPVYLWVVPWEPEGPVPKR